MTELREVVTIRGSSARLGRGLDNTARGQCSHGGSTWGEPAPTRVGVGHGRVRGARLLARSPGPGDGPMGLSP
jgi:hypothetical protein